MISFKMNMPFYLMIFYGSIMIVAVLLLRGLFKNRLPKFVFPALWSVVLLRLLVPFTLSSPLSLNLPPATPSPLPSHRPFPSMRTSLPSNPDWNPALPPCRRSRSHRQTYRRRSCRNSPAAPRIPSTMDT